MGKIVEERVAQEATLKEPELYTATGSYTKCNMHINTVCASFDADTAC
jgi:hypothetical protein